VPRHRKVIVGPSTTVSAPTINTAATIQLQDRLTLNSRAGPLRIHDWPHISPLAPPKLDAAAEARRMKKPIGLKTPTTIAMTPMVR
jgi:hypothetical protein